MEELLRGIVKPEIVAVASVAGGGVTFVAMNYLTDMYPDKYWPFIAAALGALVTLLASFAGHLLSDPEAIAGAILAGAVAGLYTGNAGHRSPKKTLQSAVAEGSLKPEAVETPALPKASTQENASQ